MTTSVWLTLTNIFWFLSLKLALRTKLADYKTSKKTFKQLPSGL
jgi:hypothetical protein